MYKVLSGIVLLLIIVSISAWQIYENARNTPIIPLDKQITIEIKKGETLEHIINKLIEQGVQVKPFWFKLIARQEDASQKIKTGEYELKTGLTIPEVLSILVSGKSRQYSITFPEGWTVKEMLQEITNNPNVIHTLTNNDTVGLLPKLGISSSLSSHPEGLFFPDTYFFEKNTTDVALLKRAYERMQTVVNEEWQRKQANLPIKSAYEALILASIVEKETGAKTERPQIAGVFTRRLEKGMLLQTDPTVIYGMGDNYHGNITAKDLTTATAYNTYVIKGLPPTPIALPGRDAIVAALHPASGDSLYFVARSDGSGSHVFSANLKDHNNAVNVFQRKIK